MITGLIKAEIMGKFLSGVGAPALRRQYDLVPARLRRILQDECQEMLKQQGFHILPNRWWTLVFIKSHKQELLGAKKWQISRNNPSPNSWNLPKVKSNLRQRLAESNSSLPQRTRS